MTHGPSGTRVPPPPQSAAKLRALLFFAIACYWSSAFGTEQVFVVSFVKNLQPTATEVVAMLEKSNLRLSAVHFKGPTRDGVFAFSTDAAEPIPTSLSKAEAQLRSARQELPSIAARLAMGLQNEPPSRGPEPQDPERYCGLELRGERSAMKAMQSLHSTLIGKVDFASNGRRLLPRCE